MLFAAGFQIGVWLLPSERTFISFVGLFASADGRTLSRLRR